MNENEEQAAETQDPNADIWICTIGAIKHRIQGGFDK